MALICPFMFTWHSPCLHHVSRFFFVKNKDVSHIEVGTCLLLDDAILINHYAQEEEEPERQLSKVIELLDDENHSAAGILGDARRDLFRRARKPSATTR